MLVTAACTDDRLSDKALWLTKHHTLFLWVLICTLLCTVLILTDDLLALLSAKATVSLPCDVLTPEKTARLHCPSHSQELQKPSKLT